VRCPNCNHVSGAALLNCSNCGHAYEQSALEKADRLDYLIGCLEEHTSDLAADAEGQRVTVDGNSGIVSSRQMAMVGRLLTLGY
jgi:hypothetical protein